MKLENQVVSLELSRKLKELGVKQESLFYWHPRLDGANRPYIVPASHRNGTSPNKDFIPAFTVAELGEMLKARYFTVQHSWKEAGKWRCHYRHLETGEVIIEREGLKFEAKTEADARAAMLIYLIENKLVDPISSNER